MKKLNLFAENELLNGFHYPKQFMRTIELGITDLEPWYFLEGQPLRDLMIGLSERYPERSLIPFARRQDNDDIACWQDGCGDKVFIIHDFSSPGWEQHGNFEDFYCWLRRAIEDFIEFE